MFPGEAITKAPSALELLVLNLKNAVNPEVGAERAGVPRARACPSPAPGPLCVAFDP